MSAEKESESFDPLEIVTLLKALTPLGWRKSERRNLKLSVYSVLRDHLVRQQGKRGWRASELAWRQTCEYREAVVVVNATLAKLNPRITTKTSTRIVG